MKKISFLLLTCVIAALSVNAGELTVGVQSLNPTEEIDILFAGNKNTNRFIHRIKPAGKSNSKKIKSSAKKEQKSEETLSTEEENHSSGGTVSKNRNSDTTAGAGAKTKDEFAKEKKEQDMQKYRELEELTEITKQGIALYTDNNIDESLNCFLKIPEKMRTPEIWLLMGNILMDKGRKDDAAFMYGRAILSDASYYKAYYNLGNIYLSDDKFNMAVEQYKNAVKYNPNNAYVYYNLGCAYLKSGELKKAKYAFIRAIELKNTIADFHYNLAYVYKKLGREKQAKLYLENYNKLTGQI